MVVIISGKVTNYKLYIQQIILISQELFLLRAILKISILIIMEIILFNKIQTIGLLGPEVLQAVFMILKYPIYNLLVAVTLFTSIVIITTI